MEPNESLKRVLYRDTLYRNSARAKEDVSFLGLYRLVVPLLFPNILSSVRSTLSVFGSGVNWLMRLSLVAALSDL